MASRRDELNAYTFAKKRLVAQFLRPTRSGSDEAAPRPLRAVVPGAVTGAILLAGFGAWGMVRPAAVPGWDERGKHILIADRSGTRYVVLRTPGSGDRLHPVLNMASAKLLVNGGDSDVLTVHESVLDRSGLPRGASLGIPYAPDRLPDRARASGPRRWAVCERPGGGGRTLQKAVLVLAGDDMERTSGPGRLTRGQVLYVEGPGGVRHVVDAGGTRYRIARDPHLYSFLGGPARPQRVSREWLATLRPGDAIRFPRLGGRIGDAAGLPALEERNKIGTVLTTGAGRTGHRYVVLPGRVAPVSEFTARLLLSHPAAGVLRQRGVPSPVGLGSFEPGEAYGAARAWPASEPVAVNTEVRDPGVRDTVCSVLRGVDGRSGRTTLATWAGTDFPVALPAGSGSAYVTPGTGQVFRQFTGRSTGEGPVFLVTDTGLRHAVRTNSGPAPGGTGAAAGGREQPSDALVRLGYDGVAPAPVPAAWSVHLPTGPRLSTAAARRPQGS